LFVFSLPQPSPKGRVRRDWNMLINFNLYYKKQVLLPKISRFTSLPFVEGWGGD